MRTVGGRLTRGWVGTVLAVLLGTLLTATIYWTIFDPKWIPFLAGVLFAAVLATASQISTVQWKLARRTKQLEQARRRIAHEAERTHRASEAFRLTEARLRGLADAVPAPVLYVDRGDVCRVHNRAAARKLQLPAARIDGRPLRELVGEDAYLALVPQLASSLSGKPVEHPLAWDGAYSVAHAPFPPGAQPLGVYLVFMPASATGVRPAAGAPEAARGASAEVELRVPADGGEALYLRAIQSELSGWDDPCAKLAAAMREDRFLLLQQRIAPLKEHLPEPICYEILLRLQEEEDNLLPPGGFLALADSAGMMEEVDRWVVRALIVRVQEQQKRNRGWQAPLFWVNLSRAALVSAEFARSVQRQIQDEAFAGRALCFELAEPDVVAHPVEARRLIETLKPLGCRFAVDAFGSGKPAFAALKALPVDFVKIDGVIVQNLLRNPAELAKARAINAACQQMGVRTAAEFVEDAATLSALRKIGVDYAQGFGIADPEPLFGRRVDLRQPAAPAAA
jgi:EAL domain-containing protein (putative c-di-GMP-specific phosphodiesterase class I)